MTTSKIKNIKKQVRLNDWELQVKEQQESGISATAWCKLKGIKPTTYFSRLRKVREAALQNSSFLNNPTMLPISNANFTEIDVNQMISTDKVASSNDSYSNITVTLNSDTIEIPANAIAAVLNVIKMY